MSDRSATPMAADPTLSFEEMKARKSQNRRVTAPKDISTLTFTPDDLRAAMLVKKAIHDDFLKLLARLYKKNISKMIHDCTETSVVMQGATQFDPDWASVKRLQAYEIGTLKAELDKVQKPVKHISPFDFLSEIRNCPAYAINRYEGEHCIAISYIGKGMKTIDVTTVEKAYKDSVKYLEKANSITTEVYVFAAWDYGLRSLTSAILWYYDLLEENGVITFVTRGEPEMPPAANEDMMLIIDIVREAVINFIDTINEPIAWVGAVPKKHTVVYHWLNSLKNRGNITYDWNAFFLSASRTLLAYLQVAIPEEEVREITRTVVNDGLDEHFLRMKDQFEGQQRWSSFAPEIVRESHDVISRGTKAHVPHKLSGNYDRVRVLIHVIERFRFVFGSFKVHGAGGDEVIRAMRHYQRFTLASKGHRSLVTETGEHIKTTLKIKQQSGKVPSKVELLTEGDIATSLQADVRLGPGLYFNTDLADYGTKFGVDTGGVDSVLALLSTLNETGFQGVCLIPYNLCSIAAFNTIITQMHVYGFYHYMVEHYHLASDMFYFIVGCNLRNQNPNLWFTNVQMHEFRIRQVLTCERNVPVQQAAIATGTFIEGQDDDPKHVLALTSVMSVRAENKGTSKNAAKAIVPDAGSLKELKEAYAAMGITPTPTPAPTYAEMPNQEDNNNNSSTTTAPKRSHLATAGTSDPMVTIVSAPRDYTQKERLDPEDWLALGFPLSFANEEPVKDMALVNIEAELLFVQGFVEKRVDEVHKHMGTLLRNRRKRLEEYVRRKRQQLKRAKTVADTGSQEE